MSLWLTLALLLLQSLDDVNAYYLSPARKVKQIYWEAAKTTELSVNLLPGGPKGEKPMVWLTFQAFYPGREPKGAPVRIFVRSVPLPLTVVTTKRTDIKGSMLYFRPPPLRMAVDGKAVDFGPEESQRVIYSCAMSSSDRPCPANGVEVEVKPALVRALVWGGNVEGSALGFPIRLSKADQAALFEFADRLGLIGRNGRGE